MTLPLTPQQELVWRYIRSCKTSPTYDEMARDLKINRSSASAAVCGLKERGYVSFIPQKARTLVALDPHLSLAHFSTEALTQELVRRESMR